MHQLPPMKIKKSQQLYLKLDLRYGIELNVTVCLWWQWKWSQDVVDQGSLSKKCTCMHHHLWLAITKQGNTIGCLVLMADC